eukprot:gb/GFBE01006079.1/.p1 GENE.gb/GFBE01006079.1/~~gb/GFBE01006079.1/.p1  ORF type:complete len:151 (+),score=38.78 gb/GFBE01006079.1/:1-453(+)
MAARALCCCALLMAVAYVPQAFVPAASAPRAAPRAPVGSVEIVNVAAPGAAEAAVEQPASYVAPLALGLAIGLAVALPQAAMAASSGNQETSVLVDRVLNKEALGAFGVADLSWNVVWAGVIALALGSVGLGVIGAFLVPRPSSMKDGKY